MQKDKSLIAIILLTFFLGPIGTIYASLLGSIIMLVLLCIASFSSSLVPIVLLWIINIYFGAFAVNRYNKKIK